MQGSHWARLFRKIDTNHDEKILLGEWMTARAIAPMPFCDQVGEPLEFVWLCDGRCVLRSGALQACKNLFEMTQYDDQLAAMFHLMDEGNMTVGKSIDMTEFLFFFNLEEYAARFDHHSQNKTAPSTKACISCLSVARYELGALCRLGWPEFRKRYASGTLRAEEASRRKLDVERRRQRAQADAEKQQEQKWLLFEALQRVAMEKAAIEAVRAAQQTRFCRDQVGPRWRRARCERGPSSKRRGMEGMGTRWRGLHLA
jgi:hypothetical protein